ncbi:hypothetical protein [Pseudonocardia parietis]|uniref:Acyl-CoA synthetase (AMP-forming)/AMP-acid ligase II n=1 Tax=Pseudonocardia parietis TaxID=570936 RepID=A0ABS4W0P9_9PSEU|nr:hypothetical protein [Pseudonocardia parietis]MBP2369767.1 acyl-CoA synthetase (AMP-forming)/AMP-acid ligase II [Pseudonocardia parietis]
MPHPLRRGRRVLPGDRRSGRAFGRSGVRGDRPGAGATGTADQIRSRTRSSTAGYKTPRRAELVDELPVLATGKVDEKASSSSTR